MNTRRRLHKAHSGPKGTSTDLMPSIMGAIDAIWEGNKVSDTATEDNERSTTTSRPATPKRTIQANNFANLSPNVQKILANVPDEELNRNFSSEESLAFKKTYSLSSDHKRTYGSSRTLQQQRSSPEKHHHKSTENLEDIISPNVQKMLSNLPDVELVNKNCSFLHTKNGNNGKNETTSVGKGLRGSKSFCGSRANFLQKNNADGSTRVDFSVSCSVSDSLSAIDNISDQSVCSNVPVVDDSFSPKPLGSYLHRSPSGIASRTPVGRKNLGKYLQVPSESSVGTNSTASSEVSRPVSLTSLGSCSSSSSSGGPHQPSSAYLASAESLDSDPEPTGSQGSADSGIAEQPTMSPEQCVLQEVMDTETIYVADLREVIEGYLMAWRNDPECPLAEHLQDLFSNIEEIYLFNRSFLEELQQANCNPTLTANAFIHNNAGFVVYTEYCTDYPRTMTVLTQLTGDEKMAALFRKQQIALGHALPLGSYLLKPVQRILKYHLLLQRLSKQCEPPHKAAVDLALTTMTSVASYINTMKRKHEHAVRVQEIQSQLYGWTGPDLTALGELIAEGTFRVGGARGRRHIFLFDKVLLIAKTKQDGSLAYKSHIMCSNLMLVEQVRGEPLSFHILPFDNPRQQCTLRARSLQHKREWTLQLKRVILENYSIDIPKHAKQLVMQLGQNVQEEDCSEKWSPLKQHSTPQYLERRSRVRKSRDFTNRRATSQDRSFVSLASWRRKSEPGIVNQYTSKTLPKRITKIKKVKDQTTAKFYTDLSDSENCDIICESNDSLEIKNSDLTETVPCEDIQESSLEGENDTHIASTTLEKVVSDLLMQNEEFQKLMNRQRRSNVRDSEPGPGTWSKHDEDELPSKADSLPRDFQLNDQLDCKQSKEESPSKSIARDDSLLNVKQPDVEIEDLPETDLSSQLNNDSEHPDHRIYRKSAIRFSLVQRIRAIMSEEQKRTDTNKDDDDLMGHREKLDMTLNEKEVLSYGEKVRNEFEKYKQHSLEDIEENEKTASSGLMSKSSPGVASQNDAPHILLNSSHSDSYYERLMEKNLNEDLSEVKKFTQKYSSLKIQNTKSSRNGDVTTTRYKENISIMSSSENDTKPKIKRPTKPPPPVPSKPSRLLNINNNNNNSNGNSVDSHSENVNNSFIKTVSSSKNEKIVSSDSSDKNFHTGRRKIFVSKALYEVSHENDFNDETETLTDVQQPIGSKGWVKTIVGRFE